ncbi:MAG: S8 family serine peptidase [Planctomycetaceae bacterium]|nr:S8 family serine peptidase [Planctomycetaceae bacterium]
MRDLRVLQSFSVFGGLAGEVAALFQSHQRAHGPAAIRRRSRRLRIEPLEVRNLMDAAGLAALIAPTWFSTVSSDATPAHAGVASWTAEDTIISSTQTAPAGITQSNVYDWIIQFDTASLSGITSVAQTASLLTGAGIDFQVLHGLGLAGLVLMRSSGADLTTVENCLRSDTDVATFEQDALRQQQVSPNDTQLSSLWALTSIDAQNAWGISKGSSSVVVAVIDTGIDYTHPDLAANIWTNTTETAGNGRDDDGNGFVDDLHGYNFVSENGNPMDDNGHGTHVSGTIGAVGNNGVGVSGVDWSVSLMSLKFMSSSGNGYLSDAIEAMNYATMMRTRCGVNVRVANCSWGGGNFSAAMQSAIQAANDAGILVVVAAGNSASNNDAIVQYPANYDAPNVISVAALAKNSQLASFSNYGATTVDIAAPGVSIYSTIPNNSYAYYSGTSMAAPQVSGVAALCWAVAPNASVADVRNAILRGAEPLAGLTGKVATGGTLDAYRTLQLLTASQPQGPTLASLAPASTSVTAGAALTLRAGGITDPSGTITQVLFYRDANNNGQLDAADPLVASTNALNGGAASVAVSTAGMTAGVYRYFAKAVDNHFRTSTVATTTVNVLAGDDFGNSAATAGIIAASGVTSGKLEVVGDTDWFAFQAEAGKTYTFSTQLGTLRDSLLSLYAGNGTTRLAFNDDYGSSLSSRIVWKATSSGTCYLVVGAYGSRLSGTYVLNVQASGTTVQSKAAAAGLAELPFVPPAYIQTSSTARFTNDALGQAWSRLVADVDCGWSFDAASTLHDEAFSERQRSALPGGRADTLTTWHTGFAQSLSGRLDGVGIMSVARYPRGASVTADEDAAPDAALMADSFFDSDMLDHNAVDAFFATAGDFADLQPIPLGDG